VQPVGNRRDDDLLGLDVAGRLQHREHGVVVDLELGALVGLDGVLDGELVEVELAPDRVELGLVGLVQADPDEGVLVPGPRERGGRSCTRTSASRDCTQARRRGLDGT
jgi:hypothetical protein